MGTLGINESSGSRTTLCSRETAVCRAVCVKTYVLSSIYVCLIKSLLLHISAGNILSCVTLMMWHETDSDFTCGLTACTCMRLSLWLPHVCACTYERPTRAPSSRKTHFSIVCQLKLRLISFPRLQTHRLNACVLVYCMCSFLSLLLIRRGATELHQEAYWTKLQINAAVC